MIRALVLGDSLAWGYFASAAENGFRALVVDDLTASLGEIEVSGGAKAGGTTRVVSITDLPPMSGLTVIALGTNDSLRTWPSQFRRQYRALLSRTREASPETALVCVGLWRARWRAWPYDRAIWGEARRAGGSFVPLSDLYADRTLRGPAGQPTWLGAADDFHPNDAGHRRIADRVVAALRDLGLGRVAR